MFNTTAVEAGDAAIVIGVGDTVVVVTGVVRTDDSVANASAAGGAASLLVMYPQRSHAPSTRTRVVSFRSVFLLPPPPPRLAET